MSSTSGTSRYLGNDVLRTTGIEPNLQTFHQQSFNATLGGNLFAGRKVADFEQTQNFNEKAQEVGLRAHAPNGDKNKLRSLTRLDKGNDTVHFGPYHQHRVSYDGVGSNAQVVGSGIYVISGGPGYDTVILEGDPSKWEAVNVNVGNKTLEGYEYDGKILVGLESVENVRRVDGSPNVTPNGTDRSFHAVTTKRIGL